MPAHPSQYDAAAEQRKKTRYDSSVLYGPYRHHKTPRQSLAQGWIHERDDKALFKLMDQNVTLKAMKNLVTDTPAPLTIALLGT